MSILITGKTALTPKMATSAAPVWVTIDTQNWTVGDELTAGEFSISDYISDTSPEGFTTYTLDSGTLPGNLTVEASTGDVLGTIAAVQGGTYNPIFKAVNLKGTTLASLTIVLVDLEIVAPTFSAVPDQLGIEVNESVSLILSDYLTDDGDPAGISEITYAYSSGTFPAGVSVNSAGVVSGIVTGTQTSNLITIVATNASGLPADITFNMSSVVQAGTAPTISTMWSGEPSCGLVVPTWGAMPSFDWVVDDVVDIDLNDYIDSIGGAAITAFAESTVDLPASLTLTTATGVIAGTIVSGDVAGSPYAPTFTATNSEGASDPSGTMDATVAAVPQPTILSISTTDGSSLVTVTFSESIETVASDYDTGFAYKVNGVSKTFTYASGGLTSQLVYTSEVELSGNNQLELVYTDTSGALKGVTSGQEVDNYTNVGNLYVVPSPITGAIMSDNFASGDLSNPTGSGYWGTKNTSLGCTIGVSSEKSKTGAYSLKISYPNAGTARLDFHLGGRYQELWINFDLFIPTNYNHYDQAGSSDNNKMIRFWGSPESPNTSRTAPWIGPAWQYTGSIPGISKTNIFVSTQENGSVTFSNDWPQSDDTGTLKAVELADHGTWVNHTIHIKTATNSSSNDGIFEMWLIKEDTTVVKPNEFLSLPLYSTDGASSDPGLGFDSGYLFSTHNFGYEATNTYYLDNLVIAEANIFNSFVEGS